MNDHDLSYQPRWLFPYNTGPLRREESEHDRSIEDLKFTFFELRYAKKMVLGFIRASRRVLIHGRVISVPLVQPLSSLYSLRDDSLRSEYPFHSGLLQRWRIEFFSSFETNDKGNKNRLSNFSSAEKFFPRVLQQDRENKNQETKFSWVEKFFPGVLQPYALLARLDKPIGTWLLAWPCAW